MHVKYEKESNGFIIVSFALETDEKQEKPSISPQRHKNLPLCFITRTGCLSVGISLHFRVLSFSLFSSESCKRK